MTVEQFCHQSNTLRRRHVREANQSSMWNIVQVYEFTKVGVDGDQHPHFGLGQLQQGSITRVRAELPGLDNVVSVDAKPLCYTGTGAPVNQKSHYPSTDTAARESPAITA